MSIPVMLGATLKKIYDFILLDPSMQNVNLYIVGALTSGIIGYLCIRFFIKFISNHTFSVFSYYRIILGIIILLIVL